MRGQKFTTQKQKPQQCLWWPMFFPWQKGEFHSTGRLCHNHTHMHKHNESTIRWVCGEAGMCVMKFVSVVDICTLVLIIFTSVLVCLSSLCVCVCVVTQTEANDYTTVLSCPWKGPCCCFQTGSEPRAARKNLSDTIVFTTQSNVKNVPVDTSTNLSHTKDLRLMFKIYTDFVTLKCFSKNMDIVE